jgi:hypothetical protein
VARQLKAPHEEELDQVSQVKARGRGIEPAVIRDRVPREEFLQFHLIGGHVDKSAPFELLPNIGEAGVVLLGFEVV